VLTEKLTATSTYEKEKLNGRLDGILTHIDLASGNYFRFKTRSCISRMKGMDPSIASNTLRTRFWRQA
jgi:hypothetical protein